ncbi:unnamed protein product [Miscanthus lutarioriparius]|uniref:Uncharacterized protein n=1 Tax=Miscanthus lutarioriparius TaxID=422564 RepID=A0A811PPP4_9POAL|nr:unnamed protein product [Miscanthus lutarioriparius]
MGLGCVAVVCTELRELLLKWCVGVSDLGIQLLALKCRKLTSLDLSYTMYELLDEMMDFGHPQYMEAKILSEFIKTDAYKMEVT